MHQAISLLMNILMVMARFWNRIFILLRLILLFPYSRTFCAVEIVPKLLVPLLLVVTELSVPFFLLFQNLLAVFTCCYNSFPHAADCVPPAAMLFAAKPPRNCCAAGIADDSAVGKPTNPSAFPRCS